MRLFIILFFLLFTSPMSVLLGFICYNIHKHGILCHDILYVTTIMASLVTFIYCILMILMNSTMRIYVGIEVMK